MQVKALFIFVTRVYRNMFEHVKTIPAFQPKQK